MGDAPKARTLWPLPGGRGSYLATLRRILRMVQRTTDTERVIDELVAEYNLDSRKAARSYLRVVHTLGFIEVVGNSVYLTRLGSAELKDPDVVRVRRALLTRVAGTREVLTALRSRPLRISHVRERLRDAGFDWAAETQVRYRLQWLEEVGEVECLAARWAEYRIPRK